MISNTTSNLKILKIFASLFKLVVCYKYNEKLNSLFFQCGRILYIEAL